MNNESTMACKAHATYTPGLIINDRTATKTGKITRSRSSFYTLIILVIMSMVIVANTMGGEPLKVTASASVSANIISMDQTVEIGAKDSASFQFRGGYPRQLSDTLVPSRNLYIVTLHCE